MTPAQQNRGVVSKKIYEELTDALSDIEVQKIRIGELRAEVARLTAELNETKETCSELRNFDAAEVARLQRPFDVAQLQPDNDSPGLWIGFKTADQRAAAMKMFREDLKP
jgi:uncharacterized small protein (DUF1192 family)